MQNVRIHGGGVAECANCGSLYQISEAHVRTKVGLDCFVCGERLDESVSRVRPQIRATRRAAQGGSRFRSVVPEGCGGWIPFDTILVSEFTPGTRAVRELWFEGFGSGPASPHCRAGGAHFV